MYQREIYAEAIARIDKRRQLARLTQEQHTDQIRQEFPEAAEIERQLHQTCFSVLQVSRDTDEASRKKRLEDIRKKTETADQMLRIILTENGYPTDYLDVKYTCGICNDSGFSNGIPCECLKREIAKVGAERMNANAMLTLCNFESFSLDYYADLPAEQFTAMQKIFTQCKTYAEQFSPNSPSIFMSGRTGLGKTHLSLAIANVVLEKGWSVIYDSASALIRKIEQEKFSRTPDAQTSDTLGMLLDCDLLIFDDFGTEFDTSFTKSVLYTLFNGRLSNGKPTIISTNLELKDLQERYGDRIVSRLIASCQNMLFYGSDIRFKKWKKQLNQT
ncbi:MAG: ATP-binding protein [Oscillospiraceae bacterium]|nr:ATP-binding protein [Oscillospiraceae bacterium]